MLNHWLVGLDIQEDAMYGIAVTQHRLGWQLRLWWHEPLTEGAFTAGVLQHPEMLSKKLCYWRKKLPKNISLRITMPIQQILQTTLPQPDPRLKPSLYEEFIKINAAKKLSMRCDEVAIDYRTDRINNAVKVTLANQNGIALWQQCLTAAGFNVEAIDILPCALRYSAQEANLAPNDLLIHRLPHHWLWVSPLAHTLEYGLIPCHDDLAEKIAETRLRFGEKNVPCNIYYSTPYEETLTITVNSWSPLIIFRQVHPPIPKLLGAYAIACGLAIRPKDHLCFK